MLNRVLNLFVLMLLLGGCNPGVNTSDDRSPETSSPAMSDIHNSRNALDYYGEYTGILPCADCEGIETKVALISEYLFVRKTKYLGKGEGSIFEESGTFEWNEDGNIITLIGTEPPNRYFVGENYLAHLNMEGNKVSGELAEAYILRK